MNKVSTELASIIRIPEVITARTISGLSPDALKKTAAVWQKKLDAANLRIQQLCPTSSRLAHVRYDYIVKKIALKEEATVLKNDLALLRSELSKHSKVTKHSSLLSWILGIISAKISALVAPIFNYFKKQNELARLLEPYSAKELKGRVFHH